MVNQSNKTIQDIQQALDDYATRCRHQDLPDLIVSGLYDLFPEEHSNVHTSGGAWPDYYPYASCKGVYLMLDGAQQLLYVGKASRDKSIGGRLSSYFKDADDGTKQCQIIHDSWGTRPEFLMTVAVPEDTSFEAAALEEYLLESLNPSENIHGKHYEPESEKADG